MNPTEEANRAKEPYDADTLEIVNGQLAVGYVDPDALDTIKPSHVVQDLVLAKDRLDPYELVGCSVRVPYDNEGVAYVRHHPQNMAAFQVQGAPSSVTHSDQACTYCSSTGRTKPYFVKCRSNPAIQYGACGNCIMKHDPSSCSRVRHRQLRNGPSKPRAPSVGKAPKAVQGGRKQGPPYPYGPARSAAAMAKEAAEASGESAVLAPVLSVTGTIEGAEAVAE